MAPFKQGMTMTFQPPLFMLGWCRFTIVVMVKEVI